MDNFKPEIPKIVPEILTAKKLADLLAIEEKKLEQARSSAPDHYDAEMLEAYYLNNRLKKNRVLDNARLGETLGDFLNKQDEIQDKKTALNQKKLEENFEKYTTFKNELIKPLEEKISELRMSLKEKSQTEAIEKFEKDKEELSSALYEALDAIISKIPQVARDAGMNVENSLKTYLPEESSNVSNLEYYIEVIENDNNVYNSFTLENLRKRIANSALLKGNPILQPKVQNNQ